MDRFHFNAVIDQRDFFETYFPAFEACVSPLGGGGTGVMCSYNEVNGIPSCADSWLLTDILRDTFKFDGYVSHFYSDGCSFKFEALLFCRYVTGDCDAVLCVQLYHKYTNTTDKTCAAVMSAGTDVDCGVFLPEHAEHAVKNGAVSPALVDERLGNLFSVYFKLGIFDPTANQPYLKLGPQHVNSAKHATLAREAAQKATVLLKNSKGRLPLSKGTRLAVVGPNALDADTLLGNYYGRPETVITMCEGITAANSGGATVCVQGCDVNSNNTSGFKAACAAASAADTTVVVIGSNVSIEFEGGDRVSIDLPGVQHAFIAAMSQCSKSSLVLVVVSGGSVDLSQELQSSSVGAMLWAGIFP
jgi:beta-D-xylosidase 4